MSPSNRVVVFCDRPRLYHLLSCISATGQEVSEEDDIGVPRPRRVVTASASLEAVLDLASNICSQQEGYVVSDAAGRRIKVKGKDYLKVHSNPVRFDSVWFHALSYFLKGPSSDTDRQRILQSVPGLPSLLDWLEASLVEDLAVLADRLSFDLELAAKTNVGRGRGKVSHSMNSACLSLLTRPISALITLILMFHPNRPLVRCGMSSRCGINAQC
mmetsp:Transcript_6452/g.11212  ORF Transcript_6452/g.11212 Transcript_6452/m.11212 type:complete len:215 (-) Transcript_6452:135-779(-)